MYTCTHTSPHYSSMYKHGPRWTGEGVRTEEQKYVQVHLLRLDNSRRERLIPVMTYPCLMRDRTVSSGPGEVRRSSVSFESLTGFSITFLLHLVGNTRTLTDYPYFTTETRPSFDPPYPFYSEPWEGWRKGPGTRERVVNMETGGRRSQKCGGRLTTV